MTIEVSTTDKRDGKALALFARSAEWQQGRLKDGRPFFAIPGSQRGLLHMADQNDCSCPDRQRSRNVCKHMRAVRLWMAAFATGAVAPKPRPGATADDDRVALTPAGAAYLAERHEQPIDTDGSRAYLAKLRAEQSAHEQALGALGVDPRDDATYRQRDDWTALSVVQEEENQLTLVALERVRYKPYPDIAQLVADTVGEMTDPTCSRTWPVWAAPSPIS